MAVTTQIVDLSTATDWDPTVLLQPVFPTYPIAKHHPATAPLGSLVSFVVPQSQVELGETIISTDEIAPDTLEVVDADNTYTGPAFFVASTERGLRPGDLLVSSTAHYCVYPVTEADYGRKFSNDFFALRGPAALLNSIWMQLSTPAAAAFFSSYLQLHELRSYPRQLLEQTPILTDIEAATTPLAEEALVQLAAQKSSDHVGYSSRWAITQLDDADWAHSLEQLVHTPAQLSLSQSTRHQLHLPRAEQKASQETRTANADDAVGQISLIQDITHTATKAVGERGAGSARGVQR